MLLISSPRWEARAAVLVLLLSAARATAQVITWKEDGDAGSLPSAAQVTVGYSCLQAITGTFSANNDVDMYEIQIPDSAVLSISVQCTVNSDPDLWLFDQNGLGVAANATCAAGSETILDTFVASPGIYYIAIAADLMEPYADSDPIWASGTTGEHAADGTGSAGAVTGWVDSGAQVASSAYTITFAGVEFSDQQQAPEPDYNGDGLYDVCDEMALYNYWIDDDWRADLDHNCWLNLNDIKILADLLCTTGSSTTATPSNATVDVYFDAAGTVKQLEGVMPFTKVDIYVIARNVGTGINAFSFTIESNQPLVVLSDLEAPEWGLFQDDWNNGRFARTLPYGSCLEPVDGAVTLMHCSFFYMGDPNCTIRVDNRVACDKPSEFPAFMACSDTCNWQYFAPKVDCGAVIDPEDIGDDGIADVCTCRYYQIIGDSDGIGWDMAVRVPTVFPDSWFLHASNPGLPIGAPASAFATTIIDWLNTQPRFHAGLYLADDTFFVCGPNEYQIGFAPYQSSPNCWVPPSPGCAFNPYLQEIDPQATAVPASLAFGLSNYPNPFNPGTRIAFELPAAGRVDLEVYDLGGRLLRKLIADQVMEAGHHEAMWDGRNQIGQAMAAGVYIYRLRTGERSESRRMVLLK